jgi:hypothetical protein
VSILAMRSHLSCLLATAGEDMGVSKVGVVMHLAGVACWVVERLPGLVAALAKVDFAWGLGELEEVTRVGRDEDSNRCRGGGSVGG